MITLTLKNLAFEREHQVLFSDLSCHLQEGDFLQVIGENGSGKSTLLRILAGLLEPHEGDVLWQGKSIFQERDAYQPHLHYIGHLNGIRPYLTCYENLDLNASLISQKITREHINESLRQVSLHRSSTLQAIHLSAGQQRRLALARLLLHPAKLWILDEPTTALDQSSQEMLTQMLNQHVKTGGIVVIATHQDFMIEASEKHIAHLSAPRRDS